MTALAKEKCIPAYPLGRPVDGRARYGMTPEQAHVYRWLVKNKPHDMPFSINTRELSVIMATKHSGIHQRVRALVERGWIEGHGSFYRFVAPVRQLKWSHS